MIAVSAWRPCMKNTLQGLVTLTLRPSGVVLRCCSLHEKEGRRWIGLPVRRVLDPDGRHRVDNTGKKQYASVVEIPDRRARERFQEAALAAIQRLIGSEAG